MNNNEFIEPVGAPDNSFFGRICMVGGSLMITIPKNVKDFEGLQKDDYLRIWFKKVEKKEESQ